VPLEQCFDRNNVLLKRTILPKEDNNEEHNIGTEKHPKYINLSKHIPVDHRVEYLHLFK
jgi:hypothetical protein